jgi:hypothetical protein
VIPLNSMLLLYCLVRFSRSKFCQTQSSCSPWDYSNLFFKFSILIARCYYPTNPLKVALTSVPIMAWLSEIDEEHELHSNKYLLTTLSMWEALGLSLLICGFSIAPDRKRIGVGLNWCRQSQSLSLYRISLS